MRTRATSACCWTGSPTTPPTSTRGSSRAARRATRPSATGTAGTTARRSDPPNNWPAAFGGGPAWTWDEATEQWYLHTFLPQQPDLNWDNPEVVEAMHDVLRFWLDRGVDGFRADVVHLIGKDPALPDIPETDIVGSHLDVVGTHDYQGTHALLRGIRAVLDEYPGDRMMVGEVNLTKTELIAPYLGDSDELHLAFDFESLCGAVGGRRVARAHRARRGGHGRALADVGLLQPRPAAHAHAPGRLGGARPRRRAHAADAARHALPLRRRGARPARTRTCPPERVVDPGGRDGCRAPIPWTTAPDHGWPADPWLPWPPEPGARSVEAQRADPGSMLHLARAVLALRRDSPALHRGTLELLDDAPDGVLAYERSARRGPPSRVGQLRPARRWRCLRGGSWSWRRPPPATACRRTRRPCCALASSGRQGRRERQAPRSASAVAASAGKNDSIASSDMVMSTAVPKVATVLKKRSSRRRRRGRRAGRRPRRRRRGARRRRAARVAADLVVEGGERGVAGDRDLVAQALEQVGAPLGEVDDPRRHPVGVQRHAHDVGRRRQQLGRHALGEQRDARCWRRPSPTSDRRPPPGRARGRAARARAPRAPGSCRDRRAAARRRAGRSRRRAGAGCDRAAGPRAARRAAAPSRRSGRERPVSTKLTWRADTPASRARSSWLRRRRWRQSRSSGPTPARTLTSVIAATIAPRRRARHLPRR